jgi:rRNA maturation protein Nop10
MSKSFVSECQNCKGGIECDGVNFQAGQIAYCPHCGYETLLSLPKPARDVSVESKKQYPQNLRVCKDCGNQVSRNADSCPQCGASFKRKHGVFFYVFWGVISLFATFFILGILLFALFALGIIGTTAIPAFVKARADAQAKAERTNSFQPTTDDLQIQKTDYINHHLVLYDFKSKIYDSEFDGKIPGVDFKIKNSGDKTLKKVEVTVYFKDAGQNVIYDEKFFPVLVTDFGTDNQPLKPNYIWQAEQGHFMSAKNVPSEWLEGNAEVKITDIEFQSEN